jgi:hypothetical protein
MKEKEFYRSVLNQTLKDKTSAKRQIDVQAKSGTVADKKRIHISRRAAIAVAIAASLLIVGSAAAATSLFVRKGYIPGRYIQQDPEQRQASDEMIPDVEHAITAARPTDVSFEIHMLPEIDVDGKIAKLREQSGQPAYQEADWAWVRELKPTIGDVLYDGKALYVTTYIETDRPDVFYYDADTKQQLWIASETAAYIVSGSSLARTLDLYGENWGNSFTDHSVKIVAEGALGEEFFPEEGIVTMTQRLYVADALVSDMQPEQAAIAAIDFTFTFDAAAGRSVAKDEHLSIPLSGAYIVSMEEWTGSNAASAPNCVLQNKPLNVDGVTLDAKIEYRPVGIYVTLTIKEAPETWTDYESRSLLTAIRDMMSEDPDLPYRINGEEPQKPEHMNYGASDAIYVLLPVYPTDYASVSSLSLDLLMHRIVAANGEEPTDDWSWNFEKQGSLNETVRMTEPLYTIEIPIPKNN